MGHESRVFLDIPRGFVMGRVRDLPRVEGHEQERVHYEAHGVVELLVFREAAVAAFVG